MALINFNSDIIPLQNGINDKGFSELTPDELITRGYRDSGANDGNFESFKTNLKTIEQQYLTDAKKNFTQDENDRKKAELDKKKLETENQELEQKIDSVKKGTIGNLREMIDNLRRDIFDIKADPAKHVTEKPDLAGFYLSLAFVIFASVALWAFYASAFYSAVFRQLTKVDETTITTALLYGNAIGDSFKQGFLSGIVTVFFPFIALMFGFNFHLNLVKKDGMVRYVKLAAFIIVTFVLDTLLAYHISKSIHDVVQLNKLDGETVLYSISMAFADMNFWMIIFLGFVPTIIWGFVLDNCLEANKNKDVVKLAIKKREDEIRALETRIAELQADIEGMKAQISLNKQSIAAIDAELEKFSYNGHELRNRLSSYSKGWLQYMSQGGYDQDSIKAVSDLAHETISTHGGN